MADVFVHLKSDEYKQQLERVCCWLPHRVNETWTMDFLHDALASGRKLHTLSIVGCLHAGDAGH